MTRQETLALLSRHQGEMMQRFGIKSLALFGSIARDEAGPESDVDVLVEFEGRTTADGYFGIWTYLEQLLGVKVDLATHAMIKPWMWHHIEKEIRHVT